MSKRDNGVDPSPEFSPGRGEQPEMDRRELLKLFGSSAALATGLGGCMERPLEKILPWAERPPELTPGVPLEYATSMVTDGFALGLLARTLEARPIKLEGNPNHPASLGATSAFEQASLLGLYDPERAGTVTESGVPRSQDSFARQIALREDLPGLWFLLYPQSSPLNAELIARIRSRHPGARFVYDSPLERRAAYEGARMVFGRPLEAQYDFRGAEVVLSLDADFLARGPMSVRWSKDFASKRRLSSPLGSMNRLYVAEQAPSPTGSLADNIALTPASQIAVLAAAVLAALVEKGRRPPGIGDALLGRLRELRPAHHAAWAEAVAEDLSRHAGAGIAMAGDQQPAATHAIAHLINAAAGNIGGTVSFTEPALLEPLGDTLEDLVEAASGGEVETLVILEANPVYTAPADLAIDEALREVPLTVHASLKRNETTRLCRWFVPLSHYLESWGDGRAYDGTLSLIQPVIRPLYDTHSVPEVLALFGGQSSPSAHDLLRDHYRDELAGRGSFEPAWEEILQSGLVSDSGFERRAPAPRSSARLEEAVAGALEAPSGGMELAFASSPAVYDGRFADNGWLQELPKPVTKLTWDNAALMSAGTAARLGIERDDLVRLQVGGRELEAAAFPIPRHADDAVTLELGYGRSAGGPVAEGRGFDAYQLRTTGAMHSARGVEVAPTGGVYPLARTQKHWKMHEREIALHATLDHYRRYPDFTEHHRGPVPSVLPNLLSGDPQWAMTIDTSICSGCSACVVACQAENNVPIVGKEGVRNNREMHWLRIDTYLTGPSEEAEVIHQPMLCQHCEQAPCEYVCPVYATQHSPDGLNEMVYNRCIGTRFCSNNCPYKVRRFNWFDYTEDTDETLQLQFNPNVTVRGRGVMEKCTYCVQRIRGAEISARVENRELRPNEVVTACQQACPTGAIKFGALQHEETEMVSWRRQERHYAVLHELGTQPRTIYLAKISNPNPVAR